MIPLAKQQYFVLYCKEAYSSDGAIWNKIREEKFRKDLQGH